MSKHTPGPWTTLPEEVDRDYIRVRGTALGQRYKIANVVMPTFEGAPQSAAEETRANARLIAAAPDLLEALRTFVDFPSDMFDGDHDAPFTMTARIADMRLARAAIAKATGEA